MNNELILISIVNVLILVTKPQCESRTILEDLNISVSPARFGKATSIETWIARDLVKMVEIFLGYIRRIKQVVLSQKVVTCARHLEKVCMVHVPLARNP